ncbi:hypothetical protein [Fulvivirga sediminis]|uniref:Uncharacterized protein n=1 Tax=Fulvivirga sediminis TaxID=2803949 RepID=A0A937JXJ4_9BACT|nr:hypothetical protein [Fulvivirga sediminis]MBL3655538.1 hypothetical protein [Fulvivirga sediminis]
MEKSQKIQIEISVDEANVILSALGQQPYHKVVDLIRTIQAQGAAQLKDQNIERDSSSDHVEASTSTLTENGK